MRRDIQNIEDDIIRKKRIVAKTLYSDPDIIEVLDNQQLDPNCPDEYLYTNIFPFIRIPGVQDVTKSYITYSLDDMDSVQNNDAFKSQHLKVVIFVHKDAVQTQWGAERHDLLAYLVKDVFHLSNQLGVQMKLLSDREGVTDTDYCSRTLQFTMTTPNGVQPYRTNKYEKNSIVHRHDSVLQRDKV